MKHLVDNRKALLVIATIVAFVAIVVPSCRMVGCSMEMGGAMPFPGQVGAGFFGDCGGTIAANGTPVAIVPSGADALVLALVGMVLAAVALFARQPSVEPVRVWREDPPPPPEEPRGERFRV